MNIVKLDIPQYFYLKRVVKLTGFALVFPFFVLIIPVFRYSDCIESVLHNIILVSPFLLSLTALFIYRFKFYVFKFKYIDKFYEIEYFMYGKCKKVKLEIGLTQVIIKHPVMSRYENYVMIIKYKNETLIKQYLFEGWEISTIKQVHKALRFIPEARLDSVLRFDKEMVQYEREKKAKEGGQ